VHVPYCASFPAIQVERLPFLCHALCSAPRSNSLSLFHFHAAILSRLPHFFAAYAALTHPHHRVCCRFKDTRGALFFTDLLVPALPHTHPLTVFPKFTALPYPSLFRLVLCCAVQLAAVTHITMHTYRHLPSGSCTASSTPATRYHHFRTAAPPLPRLRHNARHAL